MPRLRPGSSPVSAERVVLATEDPYLSLKALAGYSGISVRTLRGYLDLSPDEALPCYRLPGGGKILVRRSEFDTWLARFRTRGRPNLARAIRELGLDRPRAA